MPFGAMPEVSNIYSGILTTGINQIGKHLIKKPGWRRALNRR